jgi:F-type H+-transporting ATPase subunit b
MKKITQLALALVLASASASAVYAEGEEPKAAESGEKKEEAEAKTDPTLHFNYFNFSYSGKDEYGGTFGDGVETSPDKGVLHEEEPMSPPFIFMIANFAILMWILVKYGAPAARKVAEDRHDQIKNALDEAAKLRDQAKAKLAEYDTRLMGLDAEIAKLVDGIRADAEADKARILEQAQAQAAQLKKEADQRIAAEIELARATLTKEVTAAATAATEKLLKDKVTADDQRGLVSTFIKSVEKDTLRAGGNP